VSLNHQRLDVDRGGRQSSFREKELMWRYYHYTRTQLAAEGVRRLDHVREQFNERVVYFPRPSELNDPIDCRPELVTPPPAQQLAYTLRGSRVRAPGKTNLQQRKKRRRQAQAKLGNKRYLQDLWNRLAEESGILSLSRSKLNPHLWREYADEGAGVCIEYNLTEVLESGDEEWVPFAVEYGANRPKMNMLDYQPAPDEAPSIDRDVKTIGEFVKKAFRLKTQKWALEEEVRVVMPVRKMNTQKVPIPRNTITSIYLGVNIAPQDKEAILSWGTDIRVFAMIGGAHGRIERIQRLR